MTGVSEQAAALWSAVDKFMGRAQEFGWVQPVGEIAARSLLVSGTLAPRELSEGPLPIPRLIVAASEREMKRKPFSVAILDDRTPVAPVLVAAEVSSDAVINRFDPPDGGRLLPPSQMSILTDSVHLARPSPIDNVEANLIFQRIIESRYMENR